MLQQTATSLWYCHWLYSNSWTLTPTNQHHIHLIQTREMYFGNVLLNYLYFKLSVMLCAIFTVKFLTFFQMLNFDFNERM